MPASYPGRRACGSAWGTHRGGAQARRQLVWTRSPFLISASRPSLSAAPLSATPFGPQLPGLAERPKAEIGDLYLEMISRGFGIDF